MRNRLNCFLPLVVGPYLYLQIKVIPVNFSWHEILIHRSSSLPVYPSYFCSLHIQQYLSTHTHDKHAHKTITHRSIHLYTHAHREKDILRQTHIHIPFLLFIRSWSSCSLYFSIKNSPSVIFFIDLLGRQTGDKMVLVNNRWFSDLNPCWFFFLLTFWTLLNICALTSVFSVLDSHSLGD